MTHGDIINKISRAINAKREDIISLGEKIYENPETGFKEFGTVRFLIDKFSGMGLKFETLKDIPALKVTLDSGRNGPGIAILGELDAIVNTGHPHCNTSTGAVHACGHNIQIAAMVGAAIGIIDSGLLDGLCGKIHLIAVPAEEYIELEYRMDLRNKGVIRYLGGKPELLRRGFFDDVDVCIMVHSQPGEGKIFIKSSANGCLVKQVIYKGCASHAGAAPHKGINALYAANLGMMAVNSIRETFLEEDYIRVHPILTKGGEIVNVIPSDVRAETFVRGRSMDAILNAAKKVDRALAGGAYAMGATVEIKNMPGYFPIVIDKRLASLTRKLAEAMTGENDIPAIGHTTGSTDLGDISTLMPVVEIGMGGVTGGLHSSEYRNVDHEVSYILSSKILAALTAVLLDNKAELAAEVIKGYNPIFKSTLEYFNFVDGLFSTQILP